MTVRPSTQRLAALRARIGGYAFGGDYNPEQWDRSVWTRTSGGTGTAAGPSAE